MRAIVIVAYIVIVVVVIIAIWEAAIPTANAALRRRINLRFPRFEGSPSCRAEL